MRFTNKNLEAQFVAYASAHNNTVNILIHLVCVPLILWSFTVFTTHRFGVLVDASVIPVLGYYVKLNGGVTVGFIWMLLNTLFYLTLEPVAGTLLAPILFWIVYLANVFSKTNPYAAPIAIIVHIVAWGAQFVGHGFF